MVKLHTLPSDNPPISHFIDWLKLQPNTRTYYMGSTGDCLFALYLRDHSVFVDSVVTFGFTEGHIRRNRYLSHADYQWSRISMPWADQYIRRLFGSKTFGEAKRRFASLYPEWRKELTVSPWWKFWSR